MKKPLSLHHIFFFYIFLLGIISTNDVAAASITLKMDLTYTLTAGHVKIRVDVTNHGNEPAFDLYAVLHVFNRTLKSRTLNRLEINRTAPFYFTLPRLSAGKGAFALVGEVFFHDGRRHPFSTLTGVSLKLNESVSTGIRGYVRSLMVEGKRNIRLRIINAAPHPRKITATLYLPTGLTTDRKQKVFNIKRRDYTTFDFPVRNRYQDAEVVYPVCITLEFIEDRIHQAVITRSSVMIAGQPNWFIKTRWYWLGGMVLILIGWVGVYMTGKGARYRAQGAGVKV